MTAEEWKTKVIEKLNAISGNKIGAADLEIVRVEPNARGGTEVFYTMRNAKGQIHICYLDF